MGFKLSFHNFQILDLTCNADCLDAEQIRKNLLIVFSQPEPAHEGLLAQIRNLVNQDFYSLEDVREFVLVQQRRYFPISTIERGQKQL